jgi:hypothetical protein
VAKYNALCSEQSINNIKRFQIEMENNQIMNPAPMKMLAAIIVPELSIECSGFAFA